jgi:hypothetical protein
MDIAVLENWHAAGQIAGRGYADEMNKLGQIWLFDKILQEPGIDKEAFLAKALPGIKRLMGTTGAKAVGVGALAAGGATGGHLITKKIEEGQQQEELAAIAPQIFRAGFVQGARQGFVQGARRGFMAGKGERGK